MQSTIPITNGKAGLAALLIFFTLGAQGSSLQRRIQYNRPCRATAHLAVSRKDIAAIVFYDSESGHFIGKVIEAGSKESRESALADYSRRTSCSTTSIVSADYLYPTLRLNESSRRAASREKAAQVILRAAETSEWSPNESVNQLFRSSDINLAQRIADYCPECRLRPSNWATARLTEFAREERWWRIKLEDPKGNKTEIVADDAYSIFGGVYKGLALK